MNGAEFSREEVTWSATEKKIARRAFDQAYQRQCAAIRVRAKKIIAAASTPADLWKIHDYLSKQRRAVDKIYDYRYSVLLFVFSRLLGEGWLTLADLAGLDENKIEKIDRWAAGRF